MNGPNAWRADAYVSRHSICRSFFGPALAIFVLVDHGEALRGQRHCLRITKVGGERCKQAISDAGELGNSVVLGRETNLILATGYQRRTMQSLANAVLGNEDGTLGRSF
jgi:hypothetical protein